MTIVTRDWFFGQSLARSPTNVWGFFYSVVYLMSSLRTYRYLAHHFVLSFPHMNMFADNNPSDSCLTRPKLSCQKPFGVFVFMLIYICTGCRLVPPHHLKGWCVALCVVYCIYISPSFGKKRETVFCK